MAILLISRGFSPNTWVNALRTQDPTLDIRVWPDVGHLSEITFALVWRYPEGELQKYANLKCIASMGMGVDHILSDPLRPDVPVVRVIDHQLTEHTSQYIVTAALYYARFFDIYRQNQLKKKWHVHILPSKTSIGVMGLGQIGSCTANMLRECGFEVYGWSRTKKQLPGIHCLHGKAQFNEFLSHCNILANALPLTAETENILCQQSFAQLPKGAYIINAARGGHVNDEDLIKALDSEQLAGACLDAFRIEPLPKDHPFWRHPKIMVTPHIAGITDPNATAKQVVENYQRMLKKQPLQNIVNIQRGY